MIDRKKKIIYTPNNKHNEDGLKIPWRCDNRVCKMRLLTNEYYKELKKTGTHNHASTFVEVKETIIISNIKIKSIS